MEPNEYLPYGRQTIEEDDLTAVKDALISDFLTTGPRVEEFERAICEHTGAAYAVVVGNGTHALHLACITAGLGPGQYAIVPSITFLATANAVRYCGAEVIFCDVDPHSGLMRAQDLEVCLAAHKEKNITAVLPVHLGGQAADLIGIKDISSRKNIKIIADSCHALGGIYKDKKIGACAYEDFATFSFHPVKPITTAEGGAITTNNINDAKRMRMLRTHGINRENPKHSWSYEMPEMGFNYRLTDIQCALGLSQIKKLEEFTKTRQEHAALYNHELKLLSPFVKLPAVEDLGHCAWHLYAPRFDFQAMGITRDEMVQALKARNIGTQVHYIPVHTQPYYQDRYGQQCLPGAEHYYHRTLSLPLFPRMKKQDVFRVVQTLKEIIKL